MAISEYDLIALEPYDGTARNRARFEVLRGHILTHQILSTAERNRKVSTLAEYWGAFDDTIALWDQFDQIPTYVTR